MLAHEIRQATVDDAETLVEIMKLAFGDDEDVEQVKARLADTTTYSFVSLDHETGAITGFIDGFTTTDGDVLRLELDLLAVNPTYHGQGIATQLVNYFVDSFVENGLIRALVKVSNTSMHTVMARTGFKRVNDERYLMIGSAILGDASEHRSDDKMLIPVSTLTYSGIWLEGDITVERIKHARGLARQLDKSIVGCVLPTGYTLHFTTLINAGFEPIGQFEWWEKTV